MFYRISGRVTTFCLLTHAHSWYNTFSKALNYELCASLQGVCRYSGLRNKEKMLYRLKKLSIKKPPMVRTEPAAVSELTSEPLSLCMPLSLPACLSDWLLVCFAACLSFSSTVCLTVCVQFHLGMYKKKNFEKNTKSWHMKEADSFSCISTHWCIVSHIKCKSLQAANKRYLLMCAWYWSEIRNKLTQTIILLFYHRHL